MTFSSTNETLQVLRHLKSIIVFLYLNTIKIQVSISGKNFVNGCGKYRMRHHN